MKLILLRHGQTQWNMAGKLQGWRDSSLTPQAKRQLTGLSATQLQSSVIYSSDLGRAQATARIIANISGSHIVTDRRLRERCFGVLEGQFIIDAIADDEGCSPHWQAYHQRYLSPMTAVPGVESESNLEQRIIHWLAEVEAKHRDQTVLVVSHGEWLRALCNIVSGTISWQQGEGIVKNGLPMVLDRS
jgi:broad specificity phosphatase PhoE